MTKPIKYRVISFKDDIIIFQRMTGGVARPDVKKKPLREIVMSLQENVSSLQATVMALQEAVIRGFKEVNDRITNLENRLDTVIKLNNLRTE